MPRTSRQKTTAELSKYQFDLASGVQVGSASFTVTSGTFSAPATKLATPTANNNSKDCVLRWNTQAPPRKVGTLNSSDAAAETSTLQAGAFKVKVRRTGNPSVASYVDLTCFRSDGNGGRDTSIGTSGDICSTAQQTVTTSWVTYTFALDGVAIVAGDPLMPTLRAFIDDTGGSGGGEIEIGEAWIEWYERG